jgi:hypothetical protein
MEELLQLKSYIEQGCYNNALLLIGDMEEMGRDDKVSKIESFLDILLLHIIKKHAEKRTTRSWEASMQNSADMICRINKRRKAGRYYLSSEDLERAIRESWKTALRRASLEAFEGRYDDTELAQKVDANLIEQEALQLIIRAQGGKYS